MPTISEPTWREVEAFRQRCKQDYINARPGSIDASEEVLKARLFGSGLRGQDLAHEMREATSERYARSKR